MTKRRRSAVSTDNRDQEEELPSPAVPILKRRKRSIQSQDPADIIQELYDTIRNYKTEDGRLVCEALVRVPKRRGAPEYYDVVSSPIDLLKIQQRMKMEEYDTVDQMVTDVELMINNALAYYKKTSQEYKDACEIWQLFCGTKHQLLNDDPPAPVPVPAAAPAAAAAVPEEKNLDKKEDDGEEEDEEHMAPEVSTVGDGGAVHSKEDGVSEFTLENPSDPLEQLFTAVMAHRDETGRNTSLIFRKLPPRSQFPDYYDIINNPIDLKAIAMMIQRGRYSRLNDLEKDLLMMVKNAKTFNEPGSQVYKDAMVLKKLITSRKQEIERAVKTEDVLSNKRRPSPSGTELPQSAIQVAASLPSDEDNDDDDGSSSKAAGAMQYEDIDDESDSFQTNSSDTKHVLFETVFNARNSLGQLLSEPFMRLPIRRLYPDYYEEIRQPMALCKIRSTLKMDRYDSLAELAQDFDLTFNNAKHYNLPTSRLYKDADKLQKVMHGKLKELDRMEVQMDNESDVESDRGGRRRRISIKKGQDSDLDLKTRMLILYQTLVEYQDSNGRYPIALFMEKPSKKLYPDYYQVISEPIDMKTIEVNVKGDKYSNEESLVEDFELLFNNARQYNEEGSTVYEDANLLEKIFKDKCAELGISFSEPAMVSCISDGPKAGLGKFKTTPVEILKRLPTKRPKQVGGMSPIEQKLKDLYNTIFSYIDSNGRELAAPFIRLPTKNEYPEYYQVIKKPIDMQKIQQRLISRQYDSLEDMGNDFLLMFDNACKFNEPDSLIYKDALTLQRVLLQTKSELMGDETSGMPDIQSTVREILTNLFVSLANHQDEEGRCFSDSLSEVPPDKEEVIPGEMAEGEVPSPPTQMKPQDLDTLRRYLDKSCYRRLDCFQDHIFGVLERARQMTRTDSQVYEDAVEMQRFFITIRDEICKNGEILLSPALSYTHRHMQNDIEKQKKEKLPKELKEDAEKKEEEVKQQLQDAENNIKDPQEMNRTEASHDGLVCNGQTYRMGDFVYVEPSEKNLKLHIVCIEKLWQDPDGECWLNGNWYLRPNETFHLATRKFLEQEVFKSDYFNKVKISQHVVGKCQVMFIKEYFKNKPEGFSEEDVYTCESRYSAKAKAFKKIKIWSTSTSNVKIVPRDVPLSRITVASVFADSQGAIPLDGDRIDCVYQVFDKEREDVAVETPTNDDSHTYYEQLHFEGHVFKLGDSVYLRSDQARPFIARIDKIWKDANGDPWFNGPWFVRPSETIHPPTRLFYKNEVFLSSIEDTNPMRSICGKCNVMIYKDFISSRPTEYSESNIFVCESQYKEAERQIRKLKSLKRYSVSNKVVDDEVYFFKKPILPPKEASPLLRQVSEESEGEEEAAEKEKEGGLVEEDDDKTVILSTEEEAEVVSTVSTPKGIIKVNKASPCRDTRPTTSLARSQSKPRHASGFILFASEQRADVKKNNPKMSFGEISRLIGSDWRQLPTTDKSQYEGRAAAIAEIKAAERASRTNYHKSMCQSGSVVVFECLWESCNHQYEDQDDLLTHLVDKSDHLKAVGDPNETITYPCCWKGCGRNRKNQPFPALSRLIRHCKEVHMKSAMPKFLSPQNVNRNYYSRFTLHGPEERHSSTPGGGAIMGIVGPPTPVGMATQQLTHSSHHAGMQGIAMQSMPEMQSYASYPNVVGVGGHLPHNGMQGGMGHQPVGIPQHGMPVGMQPQHGGMGFHPQQHVMHVQGPMGQGQLMSPRGQPMPAPSPHGTPSPALNQGTLYNQTTTAQQPAAPPPPLFVAPPPKTRRLLHSEAYIRYIEGLTSNSQNVSNWQRNLTVRCEDVAITPEQRAQLPTHWLANKPSRESETVRAMWKLRDLMLHDSLSIARSYDIDIKDTSEKTDDVIIIET